MSNGRHFNPPTPAYRPRDPFASFEPRSAERVPSCETTKPPPARARPVRMDGSSSGPAPVVPMSLLVDPATIPAEEARAVPPVKEALREPVKAPAQEPAPTPALAPAVSTPAPEKVRARTPEPLPPPPPAPPVVEAPRPAAPRTPTAALTAGLIPGVPGEVPVLPEVPPAQVVPTAAPKKGKEEAPTRSTKSKAPAAKRAKQEEGDKEAPAKAARPAAPAAEGEGGGAPEVLVVGEDEEVRVCEWEKCGKQFVVKKGGRNTVRRFCTGTCRGRASEARTGKR
jgi:hypothetical protein